MLLGLLLLLGLGGGAWASPITFTIDFGSEPRSFDNKTSLTIDGVTFTPVSGHYDIIFFDGSWQFNIDDGRDLGPAAITTIKAVYAHGLFTVQSLFVVENTGDFSLTSSAGGDVTPVAGTMTLGADFADITSFGLVQRSDGGFLGVNDLVITVASAVPEPASGVLLATGLLAMGFVAVAGRRRHCRH